MGSVIAWHVRSSVAWGAARTRARPQLWHSGSGLFNPFRARKLRCFQALSMSNTLHIIALGAYLACDRALRVSSISPAPSIGSTVEKRHQALAVHSNWA